MWCVCPSTFKVKFDQSLAADDGGFHTWGTGASVLFCAYAAAGKEGNCLTRGSLSMNHSLQDVSSFSRHCRWETLAERGGREADGEVNSSNHTGAVPRVVVFCFARSLFSPALTFTTNESSTSPNPSLSFELISPPTLLTADCDLLPPPLLSNLTHSPTRFPQGSCSLLLPDSNMATHTHALA